MTVYSYGAVPRGNTSYSTGARTMCYVYIQTQINRKVNNTTKIEGDKPITMEEVKEATKALFKNKSLGIDGIPTEFYQTFDYVTEWLFEILQELNEQKQLTETIHTAIVKIIYKKGDRRMIGNYRLLSLACTD